LFILITLSDVEMSWEHLSENNVHLFGFEIWYLTLLPTIFQLYRGDEFYWWRKPEKPPTYRKSLTNIMSLIWCFFN